MEKKLKRLDFIGNINTDFYFSLKFWCFPIYGRIYLIHSKIDLEILKTIMLICIDFRNDLYNWMGKDKNFAPIISIILYPSDHLPCFHTPQSNWKAENANLIFIFEKICTRLNL